MTNTLPKLILGVFGVVAFALLCVGIFGDFGPLKVSYDGNFIKIQNVGSEPVEIQSITINDRKDCQFVGVTPQSKELKVGDAAVLMTPCDVVRITIATEARSYTYNF